MNVFAKLLIFCSLIMCTFFSFSVEGVAASAPSIICPKLKRSAQYNPDCVGKEVWDECVLTDMGQAIAAADKAVCKHIDGRLRCAAQKCKEGAALWYSSINGQEPFSNWGVCYSKHWLKETKCKIIECLPGCSCVPEYVDNTAKNRDNELYEPAGNNHAVIGCKPRCDDLTVQNDKTTCHIDVKTEVRCAGSTESHDVSQNLNFSKTWDELKEAGIISDPEDITRRCQELKEYANKIVNDNTEIIAHYVRTFCRGNTTLLNGGGFSNLQSYIMAKDSLESFFSEGNVSVWKNAEGKFNGARLASDLTAGVVLGTVGGVVSGVVIKKKQLENGLDDIHCSVGGQTIADWGDEFRVGLKK